MIVLVDPNDSRAVRNKDNVLALYDLMINQKKSEEFVSKFIQPRIYPAQPAHCGRFCGTRTVFWQGHQGTRPCPRCGPPHYRRRRLRMGAREFSESV